jgi:hypothetical protein
MKAQTQFAIIFDTNAYRQFTFGKSLTDVTTSIAELIEKERIVGAEAFANPFVMLELVAHLADANDPAYENCKHSAFALALHCARKVNGYDHIAVLADSESQLCKIFHDQVPSTNTDTIEKLCKICKYISLDSSEESLEKIRNNLKEIALIVATIESRFVSDMMTYTVQGFDPTAIDWSSLKANPLLRKKLLTFLDSPTSLQLLARAYAIKSYILLGKSVNNSSIDDMAKFFLDRFEAPLRLYNEIVKRIVMSGCDLTKNNRGNWIWDIQIAFNVGTFHNVNGLTVRVVTSDKDILKAAAQANCASLVFSLQDYNNKLDIHKLS